MKTANITQNVLLDLFSVKIKFLPYTWNVQRICAYVFHDHQIHGLNTLDCSTFTHYDQVVRFFFYLLDCSEEAVVEFLLVRAENMSSSVTTILFNDLLIYFKFSSQVQHYFVIKQAIIICSWTGFQNFIFPLLFFVTAECPNLTVTKECRNHHNSLMYLFW